MHRTCNICVAFGKLSLVTIHAPSCAARRFILQTRLGGENCAWCYLSAGLSFSILTTLIIGMPARQLRAAAAPGAGALATAALTLYLGLGPADQSMAQDFELPYKVRSARRAQRSASPLISCWRWLRVATWRW